MLVFLPLVAYLFLASVSLAIVAFLLYRQGRHSPGLGFVAVVTLGLGVVALVSASLLWRKLPPEAKLAAKASAPSAAEAREGQVVTGREFGMGLTGPATGTEARSLAGLEQQLRAFLPQLQSLYETERTQDPMLMGSLEVQMTIEPNGIVSDLRFPPQRLSSEKLTEAVYDQIRTWTFPPAERQVGLRYRLLFIPPGLEAKSITAWEEQLAGWRVVDRGEEHPLPTAVAALAGGAEFPDFDSHAIFEQFCETMQFPGRVPAPPLLTQKPTLTEKAGTPAKQSAPRAVASARVPLSRSREWGAPDVPSLKPEKTSPANFVPTWYQVTQPSVLYVTPNGSAAIVTRLPAGQRIWVVRVVKGEWLEVQSIRGRPPGFLPIDTARPEPLERASR